MENASVKKVFCKRWIRSTPFSVNSNIVGKSVGSKLELCRSESQRITSFWNGYEKRSNLFGITFLDIKYSCCVKGRIRYFRFSIFGTRLNNCQIGNSGFCPKMQLCRTQNCRRGPKHLVCRNLTECSHRLYDLEDIGLVVDVTWKWDVRKLRRFLRLLVGPRDVSLERHDGTFCSFPAIE